MTDLAYFALGAISFVSFRCLRALYRRRSDEAEHFGPLTARPMTKAEIARHSLQAEFMRDAEPGEWHELPGGTEEGSRMPDMEWDDGVSFTGCWFSAPLNGGTE